MEIEDHIKYLKRSISEEKRTAHILKAEWKTLVTPERIRRLTQRHLNLAQVSGSQLREYDASIFHDDASRFKSTKKLCKLVSEIIMQQGDE